MTKFAEVKQRLRGSIAPIITPFHEDESIDFESFKNSSIGILKAEVMAFLLREQLENQVH